MTLVINSQSNWKTDRSCDFKALRPIAQRQISSLLRRMAVTKNHSLYQEEIRKIIIHEQELLGGELSD